MGFDVGDLLNRAASWLCSSSIVNKVISNPIWTSLLITALAMVVIMSQFHYSLRRAGWKRTTRIALYLLLVISAVVFVHHYASVHRLRGESMQEGVRNTFMSISGAGGDAAYPVSLGDGDGQHRAYPATPRAVGAAQGYEDDEDVPEDCPCRGAPLASAVSAGRDEQQGYTHNGPSAYSVPLRAPVARFAATGRPDNVALGVGDILLSDVQVPHTMTPM